MPKRVEIALKKSFSGTSANGKTFGWLKRTYGADIDLAIATAVRLVYLPAALAEESGDAAKAEVVRCRRIFEEKMLAVEGTAAEFQPLKDEPIRNDWPEDEEDPDVELDFDD
ncbi:MAG: hypothetical protein WCD18_06615 [Thermosynechococcaceae cyanobacterium]